MRDEGKDFSSEFDRRDFLKVAGAGVAALVARSKPTWAAS